MAQQEESTALPIQGQPNMVSPFDDLPLEVFDLILDFLSPFDFIAFAFANYPMFWARRLVPSVAPLDLKILRREVYAEGFSSNKSNGLPPDLGPRGMLPDHFSNSNSDPEHSTPNTTVIVQPQLAIPLPLELLIYTLKFLSRKDQMNFVLADFRNLRNASILPVVTKGTLRLIEASRESPQLNQQE